MKDQKIDSRKLIQKKIKFYIELNLLPSQIIWNPLQTQTQTQIMPSDQAKRNAAYTIIQKHAPHREHPRQTSKLGITKFQNCKLMRLITPLLSHCSLQWSEFPTRVAQKHKPYISLHQLLKNYLLYCKKNLLKNYTLILISHLPYFLCLPLE